MFADTFEHSCYCLLLSRFCLQFRFNPWQVQLCEMVELLSLLTISHLSARMGISRATPTGTCCDLLVRGSLSLTRSSPITSLRRVQASRRLASLRSACMLLCRMKCLPLCLRYHSGSSTRFSTPKASPNSGNVNLQPELFLKEI